MSIELNGTTGITTPGLTNTGTETLVNLTTTGNTILGNASTDTLNVGNGDLIKDASGNLGVGTTPSYRLHVNKGSAGVLASFTDGVSSNFNIETSGTTTFVGPSLGSTSMAFVTGNTERARIDASGALLVGTTSAINGRKITLSFDNAAHNGMVINESTNASGAQLLRFTSSSVSCGNIDRVGVTSAVTYATTSDYRLKENVLPMVGALAKVAQLKPVTYTWKDCGVASQGFIAHELQAVVPDCVTGQKDGIDAEGNPEYQAIDTSFLVATLTAAIQEQQAIITSLTARLEVLEAK